MSTFQEFVEQIHYDQDYSQAQVDGLIEAAEQILATDALERDQANELLLVIAWLTSDIEKVQDYTHRVVSQPDLDVEQQARATALWGRTMTKEVTAESYTTALACPRLQNDFRSQVLLWKSLLIEDQQAEPLLPEDWITDPQVVETRLTVLEICDAILALPGLAVYRRVQALSLRIKKLSHLPGKELLLVSEANILLELAADQFGNYRALALYRRGLAYFQLYPATDPQRQLALNDFEQALALIKFNDCLTISLSQSCLYCQARIYEAGFPGRPADLTLALINFDIILDSSDLHQKIRRDILLRRANIRRTAPPLRNWKLEVADYSQILTFSLTPQVRAETLYRRGTLYLKNGLRSNSNRDLILADFNSALTLADISDQIKCRLLFGRGLTYFNTRDMTDYDNRVFQDMKQALKFAELSRAKQARALKMQATIYLDGAEDIPRDSSLSLQKINLALSYPELTAERRGFAYALRGDIYFKRDYRLEMSPIQALADYTQALTLILDKMELAHIHTQIARIYHFTSQEMESDHKQALEHYNLALAIAEIYPTDRDEALYHRARILYKGSYNVEPDRKLANVDLEALLTISTGRRLREVRDLLAKTRRSLAKHQLYTQCPDCGRKRQRTL